MKDLSRLSAPELLAQFRTVCLAQYDAGFTYNVRKINWLYDILLTITRELKRRGVEERRSLLALLADENPQVRLQAATFVYPVAPVEAKACLEKIAAAGLPDQSLSAGMGLWRLSEEPSCLDWI